MFILCHVKPHWRRFAGHRRPADLRKNISDRSFAYPLISTGLAAALSMAAILGCSSDRRRPPNPPPPSADPAISGLTATPNPIDLGIVEPGQDAHAEVRVRNTGGRPCIIDRITTTCPCIRVGTMPLVLDSGEALVLDVLFDPSEEPEFRGRLQVEVNCYAGEEVVLGFSVKVGVK